MSDWLPDHYSVFKDNRHLTFKIDVSQGSEIEIRELVEPEDYTY